MTFSASFLSWLIYISLFLCTISICFLLKTLCTEWNRGELW